MAEPFEADRHRILLALLRTMNPRQRIDALCWAATELPRESQHVLEGLAGQVDDEELEREFGVAAEREAKALLAWAARLT